MAKKAREDKNEDLIEEVMTATESESQTESGAGETTTSQKIEGALEEITRSVAGVAELIQENDSTGLPESGDLDEIEKQLQELTALTQDSAGEPVAQVLEEMAVPLQEEEAERQVLGEEASTWPAQENLTEAPVEEKTLEDLSESLPAQEDADALLQQGISPSQTEEETPPVARIEDLMENAEPSDSSVPIEPEAVLEPVALPIEEKTLEDLTDPLPEQLDAEIENAEVLLQQGISADQTQEETPPVASIEDMMENAEPSDSLAPVEPEAVLEPVAPSQLIENEDTQGPAELPAENKIQEVEEALAPKTEYSKVLVAWHDRGGKVTDEYRSLRTNLLARCRDDRFCLMVTSAEPHEGKTVSCLNLAFVMAERVDQKIVMVDLNLRSGQLAKLLNARPGPGVADYLHGAAELSEILQPTAYPNLFFIPAGRLDRYQPSELLGRSELKRLVAQLRTDYDFVLLDTPAVNQFSDAGMAGLVTGEALLVVRMNKTPREAVAQAISGLRNANVNVVGILTTHAHRRFFH
jgi:capsular exopolysaccharide synthesis family protein